MTLTPEQIRQQIDKIDCQLSPENLFCDGEMPIARARAEYNRLMKERKQLENQLGEKVNIEH